MRQWKVGTITMGLLLVTVGIISILSQSLGISLIEAILKWWPVTLIMLGLEVLTSSFLSKGDHAALKFDGFSIFITLLILFLSTGAYFVQNVLKGGIAGQIINFNYPSRYETKENKNYTIELDGSTKLILTNHLGDVSVKKSSTNKIELEADIVVKNNDEEYAKSIIDSLIKIEKANIIQVDSTISNYLSDKYRIQNISINYTIKVPENIDIEVNNRFGKVSAQELINNLKVSNSNGDIDLSRISGKVNISNRFGKIRVSDASSNVDIDGSNGDILLKNIGGNTKISNKFGQVELYNIDKKIDINNINGAILINSDKIVVDDINIQNKFGGITLKLPEAQQGTFSCDTRFGKITSGLMLKIVEEHGNTERASGKIGSSAVNIRIDNTNGDINLLTK